MQTTVCNGLLVVEQRCCRWLLMTHERVRQQEFGLTHEGSRRHAGCGRPPVTLIAAKLQAAGLISIAADTSASSIDPVSRRLWCECYETVKAQLCTASAGAAADGIETHDATCVSIAA